MKYLRTKDGRIIPFLKEDRETKLPTRDLRFYYRRPDNVIAFIGKDEIVKQADTIERLCDRFVVIYENEEPVPYKNYLDAVATQKEVYGAVWTNKGLIYVIKMRSILPNGKIDWELL